MAPRRARKSKTVAKATVDSAKSAPAKAPGATHLGKLIGDVIDAKVRGDAAAHELATKALDGFRGGSPKVRRLATDAQAVARNAIFAQSVRLLREIAAGLKVG